MVHSIDTNVLQWLILKGNEDEAMNVIAALADLPTDDRLVRTEFVEIKDTVLEMKEHGWADLFTMGPDRNFHRVVLGYVNQVFQQISGINLITYYAATIYQTYIGLGSVTARLLAAANGTEYFLASWVAVYTIEKFGRRPLMLFGAAGMSGSMAILAGMNYMSQANIGGSAPGVVSAVFLFVFNTFFAVGWLGMTCKLDSNSNFHSIFLLNIFIGLYPAEVVPLKVRAPSNGLSTSANWIFNFMVWFAHSFTQNSRLMAFQVVMITPVSFSSIGYKTYVIFAVMYVSLPACPAHQANTNLPQQRIYLPSRLLLLPRNCLPLSRGDRHHLPQDTTWLAWLVRRCPNRQERASALWKAWRATY
jgi:hypothetical protein